MNLLAFSLQPAASAAGVISRVQLPAVGRSAFAAVDLRSVQGRPFPSATDERTRPHAGLMQHRAQHRAQCRAACMSKANF